MKYIKLFEARPKSPYFTNEEIKVLESLARRLNYNISKYLDGGYIRADWCDNIKTPINVHYCCYTYNKDFSKQYNIDPFKMDIFKKVVAKIGVDKKYLTSDCASFLMTKDQAEKLLYDAKIKFYDTEIEDLTNKYNL